jgi:hypothetical protein
LPGTESIARVVHLSGTLTARSTERPVKTTTPAGSKTEASTSGTAPIVCGASPSVAAAKPYTPAEIISGKTVLGVRARISVPTPSQVGVVATITYSRDGKRRSVAAGTYSMRVGSERNLKVPLPSALRAELPLGSKVGVTLRTSTKPTGGSACAAPTEKTSKLKLKVVRVLGAS